MQEIGHFLRSSQQAHLTGLGLLVALGLLLTARLVLAREDRSRLRVPLILLVLHGAALGVRWLARSDKGVADLAGLASLFFLLASIGRSSFLIVVESVVSRRLATPLPRIVQDIIQIAIYLGVALITLHAAGVEPGSLLATSALLTAVIGLSLQDTLGNLFAGLAIQAQRPFEIGDWIQYDDRLDHIGRVIEINWRATRILTLDDVEITVPNASLAKASLSNFSKPTPRCRRALQLVVSQQVAPEHVVALLEDTARDADGVLAQPAPSAIAVDFDERGTQYRLRYFITEFGRRDVIEGQLRKRVWYALDRAGIAVPAPRRQIDLREVSQDSLALDRSHRVGDIETALDKVDFLEPLPPEARRRVAELGMMRRYARGETVIRQESRGDELFIIKSGRARVELLREGHAPVCVGMLGPGEFFGERGVLTGEPRRASVLAEDELSTIVVPKEAFQEVLARHEHLLTGIGEILSRRSAELDEHASEEDPSSRLSQHDQKAVLVERIRRFFSL